jgi:hypothetical protein
VGNRCPMALLKPRISLLVGCFAILSSCSDVTPTTHDPGKPSAAPQVAITADMNDLTWLVGTWQNATIDKIFFEQWTALNETTLKGVSGTITGKDTTVDETITLEQKGKDIYYEPLVKNQNDGKVVMFKLVSVANNTFVFENPSHDFPQKISYTRRSPNLLLAKISGTQNGKLQSVLFPMTRIL